MHKFILLILLLIVLTQTDARAEETSCSAHFRFVWGQEVPGSFGTRVGKPCRVLMFASGNATFTGARVIRPPQHGTASPIGPASVRYQPRAGYSGQDSMSVRYSGTGRGGQHRDATVNFTITVY